MKVQVISGEWHRVLSFLSLTSLCPPVTAKNLTGHVPDPIRILGSQYKEMETSPTTVTHESCRLILRKILHIM